MSVEFKTYLLSEITSKITKGTTPSKKDGGFSESGINYIKAESVGFDGRIDRSKFAFISEDVHNKLKRSQLEVNDILFSMAGIHLGKVALVEEQHVPANTNQALALIRPINSLVNPLYLLYFLQQREVVHFVNNATSQSAQPNINLKQIGDLEIRLPELAVQNKVVDILSSLDRKLVINTDINQNLESIAQAIFKSWFVDFDPVKAKMNGEQPEGMDAATASLFPEKLVESELGLIPEGWEVSTLSSLIQLTGGGTPKRSEETYWNGDIPWFSVRDVPSGSNVFVVDTDEKITELGLNKSSTKLLPKGTTIITARGTVGKLALVGTDMCMNQSCYGIRGKEVGDFYNYFNLNEAVSTLQRNTHGAVFDTITTKTFDTYSMPFGGVELANKFDSIVAPLLQKIEANVRQNIELSTLRDTLLPKLLSGEIELAEKQEN
ncbi:MAG: restriction endonuclease subunit S [Shewanella xiamenensis]|nr:restriction endonuclease subunit S [Shewanella xiamenensis]